MNALALVHPLLAVCICLLLSPLAPTQDRSTVRVFVFAGQSNMVGADSKAKDVDNFPPFVGFAEEQPKVRFWYCIGREDKRRSDGWTKLAPINNMIGPELSFARRVTAATRAPVAIIKVAAGGTTLGKDWNPDTPGGFELYPLALKEVRTALAKLTKKRVKWRLEGFVWHQGENDMFDEGFRNAYGDNLAKFVARWRRDLEVPKLRFYLGELCTKTIWGMDQRPRMHAIASGQQKVSANDPLTDYVATSHVGVEIGGGVGLHYHYGTLGQLEHGINHADAYLRNIGAYQKPDRPLKSWPYAKGSEIDLYLLTGHRNMEGERCFVQDLSKQRGGRGLGRELHQVAYRYSIGGGVHQSNDWEPLGPAGLYDTFGPEVSFAHTLRRKSKRAFAIAKFTHSGSQIVDWTPNGSEADTRNLYPKLLAFVRESIASLEKRGHTVNLRAMCMHVGENDMSWKPHRRQAAKWLGEVIEQLRTDLAMPELRVLLSQQPPTDHKDVNNVDVVAAIKKACDEDAHTTHVPALELPKQGKQLVLDTAGVIALGKLLAEGVAK